MEAPGEQRSFLYNLKFMVPVLLITTFLLVYVPYKSLIPTREDVHFARFQELKKGFQSAGKAGHLVISAYLDRRYEKPLVHLLGIKKRSSTKTLFCKFSYGTNNVCSTKKAQETVLDLMKSKGNEYVEVFFTCSLPRPNTPDGVTLTTQPWSCDTEVDEMIFIHDLHSDEEPPMNIGVCISSPGYDLSNLDHAQKVVETISANLAMGGDYVEFHNRSMSSELVPVLEKFSKAGQVGVVNWNCENTSALLRDHAQTLAMNDCLYGNMYRFKYLVFTDMDELLVPNYYYNSGISASIGAKNRVKPQYKWKNLFDSIGKPNTGKFVFYTENFFANESLSMTDSRFKRYVKCDDVTESPLPLVIAHRYHSDDPASHGDYTRFAVRPKAIAHVTKRNVGLMLKNYEGVTCPRKHAIVRHFKSIENPLDMVDPVEDDKLDRILPPVLEDLQDTMFYDTKCLPITSEYLISG